MDAAIAGPHRAGAAYRAPRGGRAGAGLGR
uniref:Uncharacterized protein n=1 Tax=Arundo donax TaxID=35708 RepID=A0A0A9CF58_ARUDO